MEKLCSSILRKLNKSEILPLIIEWAKLDWRGISQASSKAFLNEEILARCRHSEISYHQVAELHLLMYMKFPNKYRWDAYKLQDKTVDECSARNNHKEFVKSFSLLLGEKCTNVISRVHKESQSYWCRLSAHEASLAIFVIYFPKSEYFLLSKSAVHLKKIATHCFPQSLGYSKCTVLSLSGRYPDSLAQILLHTSQYKPENYTEDRGYYRPRKRKSEVVLEEDKVMKMLNREKRKNQIEMNNRAFGDDELPILEDLHITMHTRIRGKSVNPSLPKTMVIKAKLSFKGKDVLEGLRNMVKDNLAVAPLPKHITKIPLLGSNNLIMYDRWQN